MSTVKETYGYGNWHTRLKYNYCISCIPSEQTELIEDITNIMDSVFDAAEDRIEEELYKKGFMTCNSYLEKIDYMRVNGNESVQEYIKYLDAKYRTKMIKEK